MKKTYLAAAALGALVVGGAAFAQTSPGDVMMNRGPLANSTPAPAGQPGVIDQYGRHVMVDSYGQYVVVPNSGAYGITGYDNWGRAVYGSVLGGSRYERDRDGDGVPDTSDRRPNNPRRW